MDADKLLRALADPTRRLTVEELAERDGQTLFELHARLLMWHGVSLTRQALSKHLKVLEDAGLVRSEWQWRSKHHFLERAPLQSFRDRWLTPLATKPAREKTHDPEDRAHQRTRR